MTKNARRVNRIERREKREEERVTDYQKIRASKTERLLQKKLWMVTHTDIILIV